MLACKEENFQNRKGRDLIVLTVCYYMNITTEESIVLTSFFCVRRNVCFLLLLLSLKTEISFPRMSFDRKTYHDL